MNLERFIAALGPDEVVHGASSGARSRSPTSPTTRARSRRARSSSACAGGTPTGTRSRRGRGARARPRSSSSSRWRSSCRSSSCRACGRRCRSRPTSSSATRRSELDVAAVTGTNGKTTTAFLLHAILEAGGPAAGPADEHRAPRRRRAAADRASTRPRRSTCSGSSARWSTPATDACVLEATSEAQAQGRLEGTRFAVLVFTNLTQDHLNFHGTMEAYFEAKAALFAQAERAVVNVGDEWGQAARRELPDAITFDAELRRARRDRAATCAARFNRENAIGAALAARALGVERDAIRRGIESVAGVPGPLRVDRGGPAVHRHRRLRPHARLARERAPRRARARRRPAHRRLRRRRRPRPRQAAADGPRRRRSSPTARSSPPTTRAREDPEAIAAEVAAGALGRARAGARPARRDRARARRAPARATSS